MTQTAAPLPRWDLTPFFPSIDSRELLAAAEEIGAEVARLAALYDEHDVRGGEHTLDEDTVASFEAVVAATDSLRERLRVVSAYVAAHVDTDAGSDRAAALQSELQLAAAPLRSLSARLDAWVAALGASNLVSATSVAADMAWPLTKAEVSATKQMSEAEESLAADLWPTCGAAWARMHGEVSARLVGSVAYDDGRVEELPITVIRNLAGSSDRAVREAAFRAELEAWKSVEVPLAYALNGVKGEAVVLNRRRGWADALEPMLHYNAVDRSTLQAMHGAVRNALPVFRRYLAAKSEALGNDGALPWWDLFAPVGDPAKATVAWEEATAQVRSAFATYSPSLAGLAERAFGERWVDAEAREGKRGGAYCMSFRGEESRIFMNFASTPDSVSTLAHELGHAYHNTCLSERTPSQRQTPMALAETASIFCETILVDSMLDGADDATRLVVLDTDLQGSTQVVVDIHSRFLFESALFERRARRPLSPAELCDLMLEAQAEAYGEGIDAETRHPYMWAVKPHYYSTHFYNWPYTYGLLFGLGLFARYREDPDRFRTGYDDLLSSTGLASAADLGGRFGIDVRDEGFWSASLAVIADRIDDFTRLAVSP